METFIGVKLIKARPMNRKEYNDYRGWELPSNENGEDEGMLVEYLDGGKPNDPRHEGYISWSPKDVFDKAYKKTTGLTFGLAIEAVKQGKLIAREGWNGKGMFVFMRPADNIPFYSFLGIKSLPQKVKDFLVLEHQPLTTGNNPNILFTSYLCMKAADGSIVNGWLASQTDILAEDWTILE